MECATHARRAPDAVIRGPAGDHSHIGGLLPQGVPPVLLSPARPTRPNRRRDDRSHFGYPPFCHVANRRVEFPGAAFLRAAFGYLTACFPHFGLLCFGRPADPLSPNGGRVRGIRPAGPARQAANGERAHRPASPVPARTPGDRNTAPCRPADRSRAVRTGVSTAAWSRNVQGREPPAPFHGPAMDLNQRFYNCDAKSHRAPTRPW